MGQPYWTSVPRVRKIDHAADGAGCNPRERIPVLPRKLVIVPVVLVLAAAFGFPAAASAPPVGALPAGPTAVIKTQAGELVAVSLPQRANGRVWRIARAF